MGIIVALENGLAVQFRSRMSFMEASGREALDLRQRDGMFGGILETMRQRGGTADILISSSMTEA